MIRYALACDNGHEFDSWFRSSDDYAAQAKRGLIACPACNSPRVEKQIMAPQVARTDREEAPAPAAPGPVALIDEAAQEMRRNIAELRAHLDAHSENVGAKFAEEARKIHYGEREARTIHGQASGEDAKALIEEGIPFLPLPSLPDERN